MSSRGDTLLSARPIVHFTPPEGWLNDPNGLVSVDGEHHLFYQHHPASTVWGPMHWGHAVSPDFITWSDLPIALAPDHNGTIFSGSAIVDTEDTAGFGRGALVSVFTYDNDSGQAQALAWSHDGGRTFTKYGANPVIPSSAERPMCRDPKVFRYQTEPGGHWVMALAAEHEIWIYTSPDLRAWRRTDVVAGFDVAGGSLETPDLFELDADDGTRRWVLVLGVTHGAPAGGCGTMAQVGDFDGERFTPRSPPYWVDHGTDFYAAQSWNDLADGRRIWIAWMGNWARDVDAGPATTWRGQMSIPRELALTALDDGYRLTQVPVRELERHRHPGHVEATVVVTPSGYRPNVDGRALDIVLDRIDGPSGTFEITCARAGEELVVTLELGGGGITVDHHYHHPSHGAGHLRIAGHGADRAAITRDGGPIDVRIILDTASIEVLCGAVAISALLDGHDTPWTVRLAADPPVATIGHVGVHPLARGR